MLHWIWLKLTLILWLAVLLASCVSTPGPPPAIQTDDHLVRGGSLAGEGKIYFPLRLPTEKNK